MDKLYTAWLTAPVIVYSILMLCPWAWTLTGFMSDGFVTLFMVLVFIVCIINLVEHLTDSGS